jgi:hypothetical protein
VLFSTENSVRMMDNELKIRVFSLARHPAISFEFFEIPLGLSWANKDF